MYIITRTCLCVVINCINSRIRDSVHNLYLPLRIFAAAAAVGLLAFQRLLNCLPVIQLLLAGAVPRNHRHRSTQVVYICRHSGAPLRAVPIIRA